MNSQEFTPLEVTVSKEQPTPETEQVNRQMSLPEILEIALDDFADEITRGKLDEGKVRRFVREKVTGARVNGVNVFSIDFEHTDEVNPVLENYIKSPRTRVVVVEYFYPELQRNAAKSGLTSVMERIRRSENIGGLYTKRIEYARRISEVCRKAKKPIAVADIANKASYFPIRLFFCNIPNFSKIVWGPIVAQNEALANISLPLTMLSYAWVMSIVLQLATERGMFNKYQIAKFERFTLDFEQARRMYVAKGIEQLTKEYPPLDKEGKENPQIVVIYPRAHGIRIIDHLTKPHGLDKAKDFIYRLFGPNLDFSVRQWLWEDSLQRLADSDYHLRSQDSSDKRPVTAYENKNNGNKSKGDNLAGWQMFSHRSLPL